MIRMLKLKRMTTMCVWQDVEELALSYTADENVKWHKCFGKQLL
jgi:hypothetical protein